MDMVPPCPRCLLEAPIEESRFGEHFVMGEEIGRGAMGTVFAARDTRIDRPCALKLLDVRLGSDEGKMLARLAHPNIVALYEAGVIEGQAYLAMELVEGQPLSVLLPVSAREAVRVGIALCDALAYAHAEGILHRDIKPDNVIIGRIGEPKLADFGIAQSLQARAPVAATLGYAAPEALRGDASPKSDLFSLGVLLFQCCTGELPAGDMRALPWPLDGLVRRAIAQDPERRFSDAREMKAALEGAARAIDGAALPPDEQNWVRAVAMLFTAASGIFLWTLLQSLSPVIIEGENVYPLARMAVRKLADGRLVSLARLEIGPALTALALFALSFFAYGLLRRHWRTAGIDDPRPERRLPQSRAVLSLGVAACVVFIARRVALSFGADLVVLYVPVVGGLMELAVLYYVWLALLEAARTARKVTREWTLWFGFWLALVPPSLELITYILSLPLV